MGLKRILCADFVGGYEVAFNLKKQEPQTPLQREFCAGKCTDNIGRAGIIMTLSCK